MLHELRFRLLGPVEVRGDGGWLSIAPARSRQVLALLLCAPGQMVLTDKIIDVLWLEQPPQAPVGLVRNHIMRLRQALGDRATIVTRSGGYLLDADPSTVDAVRFEQCLRRARQMSDPFQAEKALEEALSYWRGPALADVRQCSELEREAGRMENLRMDARRLRAELMLQRGSNAEVANELLPLAQSQLDRERLCELTVVALARDGQIRQALDLYTRYQNHLRAELGLDPSERMVGLHRAVLRGQAATWEISPGRR